MKKIITTLIAILSLAGCSSSDNANVDSVSQPSHAWSTYRWAPISGERLIPLNNNLNSTWTPFLVTASDDWSFSTVLNTAIYPGTKSPKRCQPTLGKVEVCNAAYGKNGWLGIAQIWLSGGYIVQGTVKLNDSYFNLPQYNTPSYRALVVCQEIGHTFGLGHQDENQTNPNLGSCMDYSNHPAGNEHPNAHDYEQLEIIYATSALAVSVSDETANESIHRLGKDEFLVTHVFRAE